MVSGPRGQLEPRDWRPENEIEAFEARRDSFDLLFTCVDRAEKESPAYREIVGLVSQNLRIAAATGLMGAAESAIKEREWTQEGRAAISGALRDVRRYDEPSEKLDARIDGLLQNLLGETFEERLAVVFATKPWDLIESDDWHEVPPAVQGLVDEIAGDPALLPIAVGLAGMAPEDGSHFQFFMRCAERIGPEAVAEAALAIKPPAWSVLAAALTQVESAEQGAWADRILHDILKDNPDQFPAILRSLPLTEDRAEMVIAVVQEGKLAGDSFSGLLYGAPIRPLDCTHALGVIRAIGSAASERGLEAALGMLHQWLDAHPDETGDVAPAVTELALNAARLQKPGSMTSHHLEHLLREVPVKYEEKAQIWNELAVHSDIGASRDHQWLIEILLDENPQSAAELILRVLDQAVDPPYPRWAFSLEEAKLLSLAVRATSADEIWKHLSKHDDTKLRYLLRHTRWGGDEPEPLVRAFLLSDRLADLEDEAFVNFSNNLGVVSGSFYLATEGERDRAASWLTALDATAAAGWARKLVTTYERRAEAEKIREEEEDLGFR